MKDTFANFTLLTLKDQPIIKPQGLNVWNIQTEICQNLATCKLWPEKLSVSYAITTAILYYTFRTFLYTITVV